MSNIVTNRRELSEICSIFVLRKSEHSQLAARIDGIDRDFLFGNGRPYLLAPRLAPSFHS